MNVDTSLCGLEGEERGGERNDLEKGKEMVIIMQKEEEAVI